MTQGPQHLYTTAIRNAESLEKVNVKKAQKAYAYARDIAWDIFIETQNETDAENAYQAASKALQHSVQEKELKKSLLRAGKIASDAGKFFNNNKWEQRAQRNLTELVESSRFISKNGKNAELPQNSYKTIDEIMSQLENQLIGVKMTKEEDIYTGKTTLLDPQMQPKNVTLTGIVLNQKLQVYQNNLPFGIISEEPQSDFTLVYQQRGASIQLVEIIEQQPPTKIPEELYPSDESYKSNPKQFLAKSLEERLISEGILKDSSIRILDTYYKPEMSVTYTKLAQALPRKKSPSSLCKYAINNNLTGEKGINAISALKIYLTQTCPLFKKWEIPELSKLYNVEEKIMLQILNTGIIREQQAVKSGNYYRLQQKELLFSVIDIICQDTYKGNELTFNLKNPEPYLVKCLENKILQYYNPKSEMVKFSPDFQYSIHTTISSRLASEILEYPGSSIQQWKNPKRLHPLVKDIETGWSNISIKDALCIFLSEASQSTNYSTKQMSEYIGISDDEFVNFQGLYHTNYFRVGKNRHNKSFRLKFRELYDQALHNLIETT
tara:strand:- start:38109 stop:39761 length:1653 start_codon:yes stop_codon:yes gene_type:complete